MATLVKGPLGVLLAALGLVAVFWENRSGEPKPLRGSHLLGVSVFLVVSGGWFALAYWDVGWPLVDKMIRGELVQHAIGKRGQYEFGFHKPLVDVIVSLIPWSLFIPLALWRVWSKPDSNAEVRSFERLLFCALAIGLFIFTIAGHHKGRLIFPLLPIAALLVGREIADRLAGAPPQRFLTSCGVAFVVMLGSFGIYHHLVRAKSSASVETRGYLQVAKMLRDTVGPEFPLTHVDEDFALQVSLNTRRQYAPLKAAAKLLQQQDAAAFVVVEDLPQLQKELAPTGQKPYELVKLLHKGEPYLTILSNHPRLEWTDRVAAQFDTLSVCIENARLVRSRQNELVLSSKSKNAKITVTNTSAIPHPLSIRWNDGPPVRKTLASGETWSVPSVPFKPPS